uniref:Cullin-associated and neddylation-dissociated 1 n=1 Tax=Eptatretus burgeri TaxID=7764 RepID=A0A8C4N8T2_EPTBU
MTSVSYHISNLLEKMTSSDKDFRFMATNDLMSELQKDSIKLDDDSERKVVKMLLKLLEDKNGEVQNLAVKCLGPLVSKVKDYQVETIVDTLCSNMLSDKEQLRDISSIGLKTVIGELPPASSGSALAATVCKKITGRLTSAISKQEDVSVQLEALDIMGDMLSRLGSLLVSFHQSILTCLLPQLTSPRLAVRKRAIIALGHLVMVCSHSLFAELMEHLLTELARNETTSTTRTYIQCIAAISRQAGHRVGEHLEKITPLIVKFCKVEDDELREYCIQAFESFVRRCPKEVSPHVPVIIELCLKYLTYDPNYNYDEDDDEDESAMEAEGLDDDDEQASEDEYSDDDDMSWKVRRAAAKCLDAVLGTRHEMLPEFYRTVSPALTIRFKEREENVKADIFHAYLSLLKQTRPAQSWLHDPDAMEQGETPLSLLQSQVPSIVKALHKQLKEKSVKTRQGSFNLLTELVNVLPGALADHVPALVPGIVFSLGDKSSSSNMKIDTLSFLHVLLCHHPPEVFHPHVRVLVPAVVTCVGDPFYKITSEALLVEQQLVRVIRPLEGPPSTFDAKPFVHDLFTSTQKRLKAADIDQEVKERAIACMGQIICNLGDQLGPELATTLQIFLERLKNEITRLTTVKALTLVASSPLNIDLRPALAESISILASFLRKNQRALKLATLGALEALVRGYRDALTPTMIETVLQELPPLISESDMHVSQLAVGFLTTLARVYPSSLGKVSNAALAPVIALVRSPLLQGGALTAVLAFFQALVATHMPGLGYMELLRLLTGPVYSHTSTGAAQLSTSPVSPTSASSSSLLTLHKQAFHSIAKCVAALTVACPQEVISSAQVTALKPYVEDIWALLFKHCECAEEGTRNVVAECLGKLALIDPVSLLPRLKGYLSSGSPHARSTVVTAVKFTISDQPQAVDSLLKSCIGDFLETLEDPDLNVRRVSLVTFNSAAHNKPSLIRDLLNLVLPHLYNETKVRKELIREVEMGPFKHTVDDGLDIRKAAFECMYTLLDTCLDRLDIFEFLNHVEDGLKDHYDIKMLTFLMLVRLSTLCPSAVLQRLDRLVEPLRATCTTKVKANSVKQEFEKQDELKRSAMRAVAALLTIPEAEKSPPMSDFQTQISSNPELSAIFESIQKDAATSTSQDTMDTS